MSNANTTARLLSLAFTLLRVLQGEKPDEVAAQVKEITEKGHRLRKEIKRYMGEAPDA